MAYIKPQYPLKSGDNYIYPPTTIDQIIMEDGQRLSGVGVYLDKPDEGEETTVGGLNADTLGGLAAGDFVLKTDTIENAVNANHSVESDHASESDHTIEADDANALGGTPAINYALKSDIGVPIKLLWTNPNSSAAFAAQTITLDLSSYSIVMIQYVFHNTLTGNENRWWDTVPVGESGNTFWSYCGATAASVMVWRQYSTSTSGITFGAGWHQQHTSSYSKSDNGRAIPLKIYGIKGAQ